MTEQWEEIVVTHGDTKRALRNGAYRIWERLFNGMKIFTVHRDGVVPGDNDGGYMSIESALRQKGLR